MGYTIDVNDPNVSTTLEAQEETKKSWTIDEIYKAELTLDSIIETLQVVDVLKKKYPNDDVVKCFEEIIRQEACEMFGGKIDELKKF